MRFNKQIAIIMVLVSLLLSAILVSVYLYKVNQDTIAKNNQLVTLFVAKKDIKKNSIIQDKDLVKTTVARQYILTKPLLKKEILGKITREKIYKNEAFIKEKLSTKIEIEKENLLPHTYNSYNIPFALFSNPNFALNQNDTINIVSAYAKEDTKIKRDQTNKYSVQYVAKDIKVLGFIRLGHATPITIEKKLVKRVVKKKLIEEEIEIKAEEIVLDIPNNTLLALIKDYNRGKQLWMSKTKDKFNEKEKTVKKEPKKVAKKVIKKPTKKSYPVRWYKTRNSYVTKTATIEYVNDPKLTQSKSKTIKTNIQKACMKKDKLLLITSKRANIRYGTSLKSKVHRVVVKNYVIPYKRMIKKTWYELCDGRFVHKNVAKPTTLKAIKKMK